jgi:hypothetical protein
LAACDLIAHWITPISQVSIVVVLPPIGQSTDFAEAVQELGFILLGLVGLLVPLAILIWLVLRVLRRGRFVG